MTRYEMKRKMAAVLCMAMISGCMPTAAWAEDEAATDEETAAQQSEAAVQAEEPAAEPLVELIVPDAAKEKPNKEKKQNAAPTYAEFTMKCDVKKGVITVNIKGATDGQKIDIRVTGNGVDEINSIQCRKGKGSGELGLFNAVEGRFEALEPGVYTVSARYADLEGFSRTKDVTVKGSPADKGNAGKHEPPVVEEMPPIVPVEPIAPVEPVAPVEPIIPIEPVQPTDPIDSVDPIVPDNGQPQKPEFSEFTMKYAVKDGVITVYVEGASDGKMIDILLDGNGVSEMNGFLCTDGKGSGELGKLNEEEERFEALDPGTYTVTARYASMESICQKATVVIEESDAGEGGTETMPPTEGGDTDTTTPPETDPPVDGGQDEVKAFKITPVVTENAISVVIDGASEREVEVLLFDKENKALAKNGIIGSGLVNLGRFPVGVYTVQAQYVTPVQGEDGSFNYMTVVAPVEVKEGAATDPEPISPINIQAKVETGKDYLVVTVTESADADMMVFVNDLDPKPITKGGSVRFDGLTPGESYEIEIDYVNVVEGTSPFRETVTIPKPEALDDIKVTNVTPGVNKLTVSGKATAKQQILLTTRPAAAGDVYAMVNRKGEFTVEIPCAANTYTRVTVKYVADDSIHTTAKGSWVVKAPAKKPELTVDTIDTTSTTAVAKTAPGIVVEIKTSDYTQKVTADDDGVLRFSLPHTYAAGTKFTFVVYYGEDQSFTQEAAVQKVPYLGTLEYGDTGDAVRKLTARLEALGYPVEETSRYGSTVREAVRLFQRANGLHDDGVAGVKTQQKLFSVSAIPYGKDRYPTLVRGDRDYALIFTLQQRLKDLGYYTIKVDGIFGSGTQRAVRLFQQVNGLTVTGKADHATQALLYSSAAKPAGSGVTGDYVTLARSSRYQSKVVPLQRRLMALGYYFGNIDGYFGSQTYRAVRNFQSRNGVTVTGVADSYTQQVLFSSSAKAASGSSSSGSTTGYRLLYWGCRGDSVKRLQQALINAGYKSIVRTADGIFGQWTYDAVKAYQKDHGLAVDGIAGKNTQNSLYGTHY